MCRGPRSREILEPLVNLVIASLCEARDRPETVTTHCAAQRPTATFDSLKVCDLTQFYSPLSGGVKRYVHEKIAFIENCSRDDEHILIVPGAKTERTVTGRSSVYSIHSPLLSRRSPTMWLASSRTVG